jgi:hypothetical protein
MVYAKDRVRIRGVFARETILAERLRYSNDLALGETAAPACFSQKNAQEGKNTTAAKSLN